MSNFKDWFGRTFKGKRIAMMGLKGSGKTQFLQSLGCPTANPNVISQTEKYNWFKVTYLEKTIYIKAGVDRGGGLELFKASFNKALLKSDWLFIMVDIQKYISNQLDDESHEPYKQQLFARLDYINNNIPHVFKDKVYIILTHADLLPNASSELINVFQRATKEKPFEVLTKNCYLLNAKDKRQVLDVFKRIAQI